VFSWDTLGELPEATFVKVRQRVADFFVVVGRAVIKYIRVLFVAAK
jgi:hypothetical protein